MSPTPLFRANFEHDVHLLLRDRKQLAMQVLLVRSLQIPVQDADEKLHQRLAEIAQKIRDVGKPDLDDDAVSLADFLANLAREFRRYVEGFTKKWKLQKHSPELIQIRQFMREVRCLQLKLSSRPQEELQWLGEMFTWLVNIAETIYAPVLRGSISSGLALRLCTLPVPARELTGETRFVGDKIACRAADVAIKFPLQHFCDNHFCHLPFTMFHEVFVHGPQAWDTNGCRIIIGEHCALREGFVDAAACAVLQAALDEKSLPLMLEPFFEAVHFGIGEAHRIRSEGPWPSKSPEDDERERMVRKFRKRGRTAYEKLAGRKPLCATQLALCLNLLELSDKHEGGRLVDRLNHALDRPKPPAGKYVRDSSADWLDQLCDAASAYDLPRVRDLVRHALPKEGAPSI
jgi:hypothetical protein